VPLINGSTVPVDDTADFVVVGSGAGGGTVARWLAEAGHDVIIVEEGAPPRAAANTADAVATLYRDGGAQAAFGMDVLPLLQGCAVGGTTVINGAIQVPFPEAVYREWVAADPAWGSLLPWRQLEQARERVDAALNIHATPRDLWGGNGSAMRRALGSEAHPTRRNVRGCKGSARCMIGCPNGAKQSTDVAMIPAAMSHGARVYAQCAVQKITVIGRRARGVSARFSSGATGTFHARRAVILAAGAVHSPWLLLRSGVRVGAGFTCHPGAAMAGLFPDAIHNRPEASQSMESLAYLAEGIKFESLLMPSALQKARVPGVGEQLTRRVAQLDRVALWGVAARAQARGRVMRGPFGPMVLYTPTVADRRILLKGLARLAVAMFDAGAVEVWPSVHGAPDVIRSREQAMRIADLPPGAGAIPMVATHLFGGVPVRERFQVPGVDGLVLADASLFPTNLGVNPMSAITAVATVVAEAWA